MTMRERLARKLVDIDPCIDGYYEGHLAIKYPLIDAILDELMKPTPEMLHEAWLECPCNWEGSSYDLGAAFTAAIKHAKEGK
jgi:hypothetical protein